MWAPKSLIICLVSAQTPSLALQSSLSDVALWFAQFYQALERLTLQKLQNSPKDTVWLKPSSHASPFLCWTIWLHWQPARLCSSSHFPMLTHFGDGGVWLFIDIDGGSQHQSIFAGALDASRLKGINWGTKSAVSNARADSLFLTDFLMVQWGWVRSLFRLPS